MKVPSGPGAQTGSVEAFERLSLSVEQLRDDVRYLLDENRALQELIGRLIAFVENRWDERSDNQSTASRVISGQPAEAKSSAIGAWTPRPFAKRFARSRFRQRS